MPKRPVDPVQQIATRLRSLRVSRGWTVPECLHVMRKLLEAPETRREARARKEATRNAARYERLVRAGLCVRCRVTQADAGVRCKACQAVENANSRRRHRKLRAGLVDRRYRCSACSAQGHSRSTCPRVEVVA